MEVFLLTFFLAYVGIGAAFREFTSSIDQPFEFDCGSKEAIFFLRGNQFHDYAKDRTYTYRCKQISRSDSVCTYHHGADKWLNHADYELNYECPKGEFIGSIKSRHIGEPQEDREWMIKCCKNDEVKLTECRHTPHFLNDIRQNFEYSYRERIFIGLRSVHYNEEHNEDRRWQVTHCDYIQKTTEDTKKCGEKGWGLTKIHGTYNSELLDRDWKYECELITDQDTTCYWTGYSNDLDGVLHVNCRRNYFIAGIDSYYHYYEKDRAYRVYCCTAENLVIENSKLSDDYINKAREEINWKIDDPAVKVLTGLESYHDKEDRRWKLEISEYFVNDWTFKCSKDGEAIFKFESASFDESKLDRSWNWHCKKVTDSFSSCYWTDYLNKFDKPLNGQCNGNYALTGISSYYARYARDRTWKIQCCTSEKLALGYCNTGNEPINDYRGIISYTPDDYNRVLTGLYSEHSDTFEDRIWKVSSCRFLKKPDQSFDCPDGHGLGFIESKYFKNQLDRLWNYKCVRVADTFADDCYWIGGDENKYINEGDKEVNAKCNEGYVISSVKSSFDDLTNDRRWNTKCCRNKNAAFSDCKTTPVPVNQYQRELKVEVNINHVITGMESSHDDYNEDRRWKITYCKFQCCQ